jgi:hypothetical protein
MVCGVITTINIGLYLINQQAHHVAVGYVEVRSTIEESIKGKLNLKWICFKLFNSQEVLQQLILAISIMVRLDWVQLPATSQAISIIWRL